jgi:hypothetical protein
MEVSNYYKYGEEKIDGTTTAFGWVVADSLPEDEDYIVAYHSRSKFASDEEVQASKTEGTNGTTVSDYRKFFEALTGTSPAYFYEKWDTKEEDLNLYWRTNYPEADDKQYMFMLKLARLIVTGKKFVMYSRGFKLVNADERGNTPTEV